jgi:hypothetical protein
VLGKSYGALVCLGRERSKEFTGGGWLGCAREWRGVLYPWGLVEAVARNVVAYSGNGMAWRRWATCGRPTANGERRRARGRVCCGRVVPA